MTTKKPIPPDKWKWFGNAGHLIVGDRCQFHMTTQVGDYLVSTVGEYLPDEPVREIFANSRGVKLEGRGDDRLRDYMDKIGYEPMGAGPGIYETMVFGPGVTPCSNTKCGKCGIPQPKDWGGLEQDRYMTAGDATRGHYKMCKKYAKK